jgi:hypothetical protein
MDITGNSRITVKKKEKEKETFETFVKSKSAVARINLIFYPFFSV